MKVAVSACLLGTDCKYNGGNNRNEKVLEFIKDKGVIPVCPEVAGGLPTPRTPSEIVNNVVTNKEGIVVDKEFRLGAKLELDRIKEQQVDLVILQSRSPSCGVKQIYDGTFSGTKIDGHGIFASLLLENNVKVIDVEDL